VDYHLMSNVPGLFVIGEANFSDHGANRLGASALMQGLADGYFVLPDTIGDYLARLASASLSTDTPPFAAAEGAVRARLTRFIATNGSTPVDSFHRQLGAILWEACGMSRTAAGLAQAIEHIRALRARFWADLRVVGTGEELNRSLERAGRVADYMEFAELMCEDARHRQESCGAHFREEYQTSDGEALRDDEDYCYVACWQHTGEDSSPVLHQEPLVFEEVELATRSYK
jgi:succinate dehydrogenase / fumarate reductase flavoprotein subunit